MISLTTEAGEVYHLEMFPLQIVEYKTFPIKPIQQHLVRDAQYACRRGSSSVKVTTEWMIDKTFRLYSNIKSLLLQPYLLELVLQYVQMNLETVTTKTAVMFTTTTAMVLMICVAYEYLFNTCNTGTSFKLQKMMINFYIMMVIYCRGKRCTFSWESDEVNLLVMNVELEQHFNLITTHTRISYCPYKIPAAKGG